MIAMFGSCSAFNNGGVSSMQLYTDKVTTMEQMFYGCIQFNATIDSSAGYWNTSQVTNMNSMFGSCSAFNNGGVSTMQLYTDKVTTMEQMFSNCTQFNAYIDSSAGYWNTSQVTNMSTMFQGCSAFNNGNNPLNLNTNNVTSMLSMFQGCTQFNAYIDSSAGYWNTSKVTSMNSMFRGCTNFNNNNNSLNFITSAVVFSAPTSGFSYMFNNAASFNNGEGFGGTTQPLYNFLNPGYWTNTFPISDSTFYAASSMNSASPTVTSNNNIIY